MICFLYHIDPGTVIPLERPFADQVVGYMFGWQQVIIDPHETFHKSEDKWPLVLRSLEEARQHPWLKDLRWVYLSAGAKNSIQEFEHPDDNIIYCIGSDAYGFGEDVSMHETLRLFTPDPDKEEHKTREFFTATVLPMVAYDRALKLWQRHHSSTT